MPRARILAVVVLLLSYGALGARQPAVRTAVPLPMPAATLAESLRLSSADRSRMVLDAIRVAYEAPEAEGAEVARIRGVLQGLAASTTPGETAPLPLDPSIWRDTLLGRDVPDAQLLGAILSDRRTALFYYGLAALDDETLAWLGPDRGLVSDLSRHAATFAAFGRSLRLKAGRILVPGGGDAERIWEAVVGASPARPAAFARRLFSQKEGRLAFLYDTVAHLTDPAQRFALGASLPATTRVDRARALAQLFEQTTGELRPEHRPFARQLFDPSLTLSLLKVDDAGRFVGPAARWVWDAAFRHEGTAEPRFEPFTPSDIPSEPDASPIDAAWIGSRIHRGGFGSARRRLETVLFAQRNLSQAAIDPVALVTAIRATSAFPALVLTLERSGLAAAPMIGAAAARAESLSRIDDDDARRTAIVQFQGALSIVTMAMRSSGLSRDEGRTLVSSLMALDVSSKGYEGRLARWIQTELLPCLAPKEADRTAERTILAAIAGVRTNDPAVTKVEWEGQQYVVDPGRAELRRLLRARQRQGGESLDEALAAAISSRDKAERQAGQKLADVLASIVYAAHLGDPEGGALAAGNVALRHDPVGGLPIRRAYGAWQLPAEEFGEPGGWRVSGSLLGLEVPLARLALRRLDSGNMPPGPRLTSTERHSAALTVALMNPVMLTDAGRDEIASAIARGRSRLGAATADRDEIERIARAAGLTEWRREALAWTIAHDRERVESQFSLVELFWLGSPRTVDNLALDAWGIATLRSTGCLCLEMPRPNAGDHLAGRPVSGMLGLRGADVALRIAQRLAELQLPAALAPGIIAYAMQDVLDSARLAHQDDWSEFSRAVQALDDEVLADYLSAVAAGGALMPADNSDRKP